jgi:hypothetical protein
MIHYSGELRAFAPSLRQEGRKINISFLFKKERFIQGLWPVYPLFFFSKNF